MLERLELELVAMVRQFERAANSVAGSADPRQWPTLGRVPAPRSGCDLHGLKDRIYVLKQAAFNT
jgi:hypothetical protein